MWTASIVSIVKSRGKTHIKVDYTDGIDTLTITHIAEGINCTKDWLISVIRNEIQKMERVYALADEISLGNVDITITPPIPTQEEIDRDKFIQDYRKFIIITRIVNLGILTGQEPFITNLVNTLKTNFKQEYINLL